MVQQVASCVRFVGICKSFDTTPVLDGIDLTFPAGKTTAVVGAQL